MTTIERARRLLSQPLILFPVGKKAWRSRALGALLGAGILLGAAAPTAALAHEGDGETSRRLTPAEAATQAPFVDLGVFNSRKGEDKDAFMMRVGKFLNAFTHATEHEACGMLMAREDGTGWRVRVSTNRSQLACASIRFDETGMRPTRETIHTHPSRTRYIHANARDTRLRGFRCGSSVIIAPFDFSDGDYENGPGYLVVDDMVYYQNGPDQRREVGRIDTSTRPEAPSQQPWTRAREVGHPHQVQAAVNSALAWTRGDVPGLPDTSCKSLKR